MVDRESNASGDVRTLRPAPLEFTRLKAARPDDEFDLDIRMADSDPVKPMLPPESDFSCFGCDGGGDTEHCAPDSAFCGSPTDDDCGGGSQDDTCGQTCDRCRTDAGNTCNTCQNTCNQATCQTCNTNCNQATCATCNQGTCNTCDTCAGQATCKRTCDCETMNIHACGDRG